MRKLLVGVALALSLAGCKSSDKAEQPAEEPPAKAKSAKCSTCGMDGCACGCDGDAAKCECKK